MPRDTAAQVRAEEEPLVVAEGVREEMPQPQLRRVRPAVTRPAAEVIG
jgi:hypothetical protein